MEMIADFRKSPDIISPLQIVGRSNLHSSKKKKKKNLGTVIEASLTFEHQVDAVCRKFHQRVYFYQKKTQKF